MFPVEIWGTVASWAEVVIIGGSAVVAAGYYVNDKRLAARAQARQIRVLLTELSPRFTASVFNYSDKAIYDVAAETQPMTLTEILVYRKTAVQDKSGKAIRPNAELMAKLQAMFSRGDAPERTALMENDRALEPGDKVEMSYERPESPAARYSVVFRDHMSRRWRLEYWTDEGETHTRLTRSRDRHLPSNAWDLARHPIRERAFIRRWLSIWRWERRNPKKHNGKSAPADTSETG